MAEALRALESLKRTKSGEPTLDDLFRALGVADVQRALDGIVRTVGGLQGNLDTIKQGLSEAFTGALSEARESIGDSVKSSETSLSEAVQGVSSQVQDIPEQVRRMIPKTKDTDLSPVINRLLALETRVSEIRIPEAQHIEIPEVDMTPFERRMAALESRIDELSQPRVVTYEVERVNQNPMSPVKRIRATEN